MSEGISPRQAGIARRGPWRTVLCGATAVLLGAIIAANADWYEDLESILHAAHAHLTAITGDGQHSLALRIGAVLALIAAGGFITGVFGSGVGGAAIVGGNVMLLGVTTGLLVSTIVLLSSCILRVASWRSQTRWDIVGRTGLGSAVAFAVIMAAGYYPTAGIVLVLIATPTLLLNLVPRQLWPSIDRLLGQYACGVLSGTFHVFGGSGPSVMPSFMQKTRLTRLEVVATSSGMTLPLHGLRLGFLAMALSMGTGTLEHEFPPWAWAAAIALGLLSTWAGGWLLRRRISEAAFSRWSWGLAIALAWIFLARGLWLLLA